MSYRRFILIVFAAFFGYLLWVSLQVNTDSASTWPLVFGMLVTLMLPEKRFQAETFVGLVEALKGGGK